MPEGAALNVAYLSDSIRHLISHKKCCPCLECVCKPKKRRRRKEPCVQDNSCPQRIEEIALPLLRRVDYTLQRYGPRMGPEMVVKMCRLVHELSFPQPKASNFCQRQPQKKRRPRRRPSKSRKEEEAEWLQAQASRSSWIFHKYLQHLRDFIPTYKQLQVSIKLYTSLNLRKAKGMNRYLKAELKRICDKLAILIDVKLEPYKQELQVDSASASTLEDKHCIFKMFDFEYESETEVIEMSEEEEGKEAEGSTFFMRGSSEESEAGEGVKEEAFAMQEATEEVESAVAEESEMEAEEESLAEREEVEEEVEEGSAGEQELLEESEMEEEYEEDRAQIEREEEEKVMDMESEEEQEVEVDEEEEERRWMEEKTEDEEWSGGIEEVKEEMEAAEASFAGEVEEVSSYMESVVEGEQGAVEEVSIMSVVEEEAHAEGTSSYIDWCLYVSWLREFGNNMETYAMCLHQFRYVLTRGYDTKTLQFVLRNWSDYLADSRRVDAQMTQYFKEKPITVCPLCTDCTIDDYPSDHYIPPELEAAIMTTKNWRKLLAEAEDYCRQLSAEEEAHEEAQEEIEFEQEFYEILDVSSSSSSSYIIEQ